MKFPNAAALGCAWQALRSRNRLARDDATWEIAENLHRLDLTKEQRDEHLRRYGELVEAREAARTVCPTSLSDGRRGGPQHQRGVAAIVAEETGLSQRTVRRALNPKPVAEVIPIAARSQEDVILMQANAIVVAWNRASPEAREIAVRCGT